MKTKSILALALLAIMLSTMFAAMPAPVVKAATNQPLFSITMIAPGNANLLRREWALIIANSFDSVGIDARVVFMGWGSVYDRALTPAPENIGKTWAEGGFDALFIGWTPGAPSTPFVGSYQIYYSKNIPPNANYMLWNNTQSDQLLGECLTTGYTTQGIIDFKNWQYVQYIDVPASQLFWTTNILSADPALNFNGFAWAFDNIGPNPQFLSGNVTTVTLGTTGELLNLCPPLSNSWYDTEAFSAIFDGLYTLDSNLNYIPAIASAAPTISNNGSTFIYPIRTGVTFQDGVPVTADDVLFTWLAYLNPNDGSQQAATIAGYIGDDISFTWLNGTTTRLVLDLVNGIGYYPANSTTHGTSFGYLTAIDANTVNVTIGNFPGLNAPAATFHPEGEPGAILPMHILENIPFADWTTSGFTTGASYTVNGVTYNGPVGAGPYSFVSYDPTAQIVYEQKYTGYWNKTGLESQGLFTVTNFDIRYIADKDGAIAALKNHEVQILDSQYSLQNDYAAGNLNFATNYQLPGSGEQQLGYNLQSPIWGTGTATPLGQSNASRAAEAARDVRTAFDYLIPRQLLIDTLLAGFGTPAAVQVNPVSPYYNTSIVPRDYSPTLALQYLAMAGYNVTVTPSGTTNYFTTLLPLTGTTTLSGTFAVNTTIAAQNGGLVLVLQKSADGANWVGMQMQTTTTGAYSFTFNPDPTCPYYQVVMTGIDSVTATAYGFTDPSYPFYNLPGDIAVLPTLLSPVTTLSTDGNAILTLQNQTATAFSALNASMTSQISSLNSQVSNLSSQIGNLTNYLYVAIAVAIIAIIIAIVLGMRKK
jgi:ABC-type transport system substrate-binding protein